MKSDIKNEINFIKSLTEIKKLLSLNKNNEQKIIINSTINNVLNNSNEKKNKDNNVKRNNSNKSNIYKNLLINVII